MADDTLLQERRDFYVYVIFRPNGVPCYVGKGHGERWRRHIIHARNPHLRNIYEQASGDLPAIKLCEGLTETAAFEIEIAFIAAIGRECSGGPLINLTDGGDGPVGYRHTDASKAITGVQSKRRWADPKYREKTIDAQTSGKATPEYRALRREISTKLGASPEFRAKISASKLAAYEADPDLRTRVSEATKISVNKPEVRARISAAQKARFSNPEEIEKLSNVRRGKKLSDAHKRAISFGNLGRIVTEETRQKIRASNLGRKMTAEDRMKMSIAAKARWARHAELKLADAVDRSQAPPTSRGE